VQVQAVDCCRRGPLLWIEVQAGGFLYRMMRLLVGTLAFVGRGELSVGEFVRLWQDKQLLGTRFRHSVPARGLCLLGIGYADDPFACGIRGSPGESVFPPFLLSPCWSLP
ncbi:MAG: hypothetical protein Q6J78_03055, partial [Thermostichales cyanobacterium SRBZ-1_bins_19]